jgi:hypothetical protein
VVFLYLRSLFQIRVSGSLSLVMVVFEGRRNNPVRIEKSLWQEEDMK